MRMALARILSWLGLTDDGIYYVNGPDTLPPPLSAEEEEAISALMGLGFTKNESVQAVKRAHEAGATSTEEIIRKALQGGI